MSKKNWKLVIHRIAYRNAHAPLFDQTAIELSSKKVYGVMGPSGSGKTSLWEALIQYPKKHLISEIEIQDRRDEAQEKPRIALLPQQPAYTFNPTIKVGKSLDDVLKAHSEANPYKKEEIIEQSSIPEGLLNKYPQDLSGGEIQRMAYAMALAMHADWLILDEPTASLDRITASKVLDSAVDWANRSDRICFISSHDGELLANYCDEIILLQNKKLKEPRAVQNIRPEIVSGPPSLRNNQKRPRSKPLLQIEEGKFYYGSKSDAFKLHINLQISGGTISGLCGKSACGKSTLGRLLASYLDWKEGRIHYAENIESISDIQYIPQDPILNFHPSQSLGQQLLPIYRKWWPESRREDFNSFLEKLSIEAKWMNHSILELSGGQRQRLLLARALIPGPKLLIMDESLSALDTPTAISILKWLKQIQDDRNLTLLIISHDLRILLSICDKIEIMSAGRLVDQIEPGEIKNKFNSSVTKRLFKTYNI